MAKRYVVDWKHVKAAIDEARSWERWAHANSRNKKLTPEGRRANEHRRDGIRLAIYELKRLGRYKTTHPGRYAFRRKETHEAGSKQ